MHKNSTVEKNISNLYTVELNRSILLYLPVHNIFFYYYNIAFHYRRERPPSETVVLILTSESTADPTYAPMDTQSASPLR